MIDTAADISATVSKRSRSGANAVTADDGAYVSLQSLLHCRLLAKNLNLSKQRKLLSSQAGTHTSRFRGRGIDFNEVRGYQPGDDIRSIDWRVTARTGKPHTKLYSEERERPALVLVDQRRTMFFGSRIRFKSVSAAQAAVLLAWATLARGDRVGGIVLSDRQQREIRPARSQHAVLQLIDYLMQANHSLGANSNSNSTSNEITPLAEMLEHTRRTTKPGSEVFIVSDFHDFDKECQHQLFQLSRHNDLVSISVADALEAQLPPPGSYALSDGITQTTLNLNERFRTQYQQQYRQQAATLKMHMDQMKIPLIHLHTDAEPLRTLQLGLGLTRGRR